MDDGGETIDGLGASNLASFVLARLERFAGLLADQRVQEVPAWHRLARRAAAAGFADAVALGLRDEAPLILRAARRNLPHSA